MLQLQDGATSSGGSRGLDILAVLALSQQDYCPLDVWRSNRVAMIIT